MKKMARHRYTVKAVNLIVEDDDLGDINASDLEDTESDDGNIEEADYISSSGEGQLVSLSVLQSRAACEEDSDEPALRDSLLLLDEDLCESDDETEVEIETDGSDMEIEASEASESCGSDVDDRSDGDPPSYSPPAIRGRGVSRSRKGERKRTRERSERERSEGERSERKGQRERKGERDQQNYRRLWTERAMCRVETGVYLYK